MPKIDLYKLFGGYSSRAAWKGSTASAQSLMHAIEKNYRGTKDKPTRTRIVWQRSESLPTFKYPYPFPVHNQCWAAEWTTDHKPIVTLNMAGRKWTLRLRCDDRVSYQLAGYAHLANGSAIPGELALYRIVSFQGNNRATVQERAPGGGKRCEVRIMIKMVAWLPQPNQERQAEGTMRVTTGLEDLLVASTDTRERAWFLVRQDVRNRIATHRKRIQGIRSDMKHERRRGHMREGPNEAMADLCRKHNRYMDQFVKETAAHLVAFANRCGLAEITYDDTVKVYFGDTGFPWFRLEKQIAYKCESEGIAYRYLGIGDKSIVDVGDASAEAMKSAPLLANAVCP